MSEVQKLALILIYSVTFFATNTSFTHTQTLVEGQESISLTSAQRTLTHKVVFFTHQHIWTKKQLSFEPKKLCRGYLTMKKYFPWDVYARGEVPTSIIHLLPDSDARKTREHTCFTSDARPAVTPCEALWCQKHTDAKEDDGIRDTDTEWKPNLELWEFERERRMKNPERDKKRRKPNYFLVRLPPLRQMWWLQQMFSNRER